MSLDAPRLQDAADDARASTHAGPSPDTPVNRRLLDDRRDAPALAGLLMAVVIVHILTHRGGIAVGMDMATQFIPWYGWLGDQLANGHIPQWNPAVFSGMPSAGDPLSGWGYLPAMLPYTLLDVGAATHVFLVAQLALVASGTYVLARTMRLPVIGAIVAALAATFNGFVLQRNACCVAFVSVQAWIPWLLLGIDRALVTSGRRRVGAWSIAAFAVTQIAGGWLGQGALYVAILAATWLVGRVLFGTDSWPRRWRLLLLHAPVLAMSGLGLAAAVMWPRLSINPSTNLAGGYPGQSLDNWHSGWWPADWVALVQPGIWYAGAVTLVLAAVAIVVARRDRRVWLLAGIVVLALALALPTLTPVNAPLLAVPGFDRVLTHAPQRALLMAYPALALLAGIAVSHIRVPHVPRRVVAVALLVLLGADLALANSTALSRSLEADRNPELVRRIDPDTFYEPSAAGRYLQQRRDGGDIGRYAAFTPVRRDDGSLVSASYFFFWHYPSVQRIEAHNESLLLGLEHVQGYNPIHLARYDDLITAANGREQDYHVANLFPGAFDRGVFDLLNGRWVVMSAGTPHRDSRLVGTRIASWSTVYSDRQVRVLENPDALPRAWVVHDVRRANAAQALPLVLGDDVDPRTTAFVEAELPVLDANGTGTATVVDRTTDTMRIDVDNTGDGLLVLSEVFHPAWRATVDGRPAEVLAVDGVLRGVPVPAGRHTVELHIDTTVLHLGLLVSGLTAAVLALAAVCLPRTSGARRIRRS